MSPPPPRSHRLASSLAWSIRRPRTAVTIALVVLGLAAVALANMRLDPDVEGLLDGPAARTYGEVARLFGWRERAFVLIEAEQPGSTDLLIAAGRALRERLSGEERTVAGVEFGAPGAGDDASERTNDGSGNADDGVDAVDDTTRRLLFPYGFVLLQDPDVAAEFASEAGVERAFERQVARLSMPGLGDQDEAVLEDPLGLRLRLARRLVALRGGFRFAPGSPYFLDEDRQALMVVVRGRHDPSRPAGSAAAAAALAGAIDTAIESTRSALGERADGLRFATTGACYFAAESQSIVRNDLIVSLSASILLAAVLLMIGLRLSILRVLCLCLPTLWGTAVGIGAFVAFRSEVSGLSFACAAVLVGLGIDFTIHITTTALQQRGLGWRPAAALLRAFRETGGRLVLAACTSAAAFVAFLTSDAGFLRDMGLMTVLGLATCLVAPFLLLPAILLPMLARIEPTPRAATGGASFRLMSGCAWLAERAPRTVLIVTGVVVVLAAAGIFGAPPRVEDDLRRLHAADSEALATQQRMGEVFGGSFEPTLLLLQAPDERELLARCAAVESALAPLLETSSEHADGGPPPLVSVLSLTDLLPDVATQQQTLDALAAGSDPAAVRAHLERLFDEVGFEPGAGSGIAGYLDGFERALGRRTPVLPSDLVERGLEDLVGRFAVLATPTDPPHALVLLQPERALWDAAARRRVIDRVERAVDGLPGVVGLTGLLPTAVESSQLVIGNFSRVAGLTLVFVLVVLVLRFRRPRSVLLVLAPAGIGVVLVGALFTPLDVRLNLMNVGVLPMVLALGIDDGIHVVAHALGRNGRRRPMREVLQSTGSGVLMTSATTMVTFGSLALSRSRGLSSVGTLSFVGIGICLLASVVVLPALLELLAPRRRGTVELADGAGRLDHGRE